MNIGILGLQGAVKQHQELVISLGHSCQLVRQVSDLEGIDGLIFPGGESTVQQKLMNSADLTKPIHELVNSGLPALATCAGLILLSNEITDGTADQLPMGLLPISVQRNGYGRQNESFECDVAISGISEPKFHAVFIRAPKITSVGEIEILADLNRDPILIRHGQIFGSVFHPELTNDSRLHKMWLDSALR